MSLKLFAPLALVGIGVAVWFNLRGDGGPAPDKTDQLAQQKAAAVVTEERKAESDAERAARTIDGIVLPPEFFAKMGPQKRVEIHMPSGFKSGLRCPDGSFLPLLNGVPNAEPLYRDPIDGPLPPVRALVTDSSGFVWYEHEDGSVTTTRWAPITLPDGSASRQVQTSHHVPLDGKGYDLRPDGTLSGPGASNPSPPVVR